MVDFFFTKSKDSCLKLFGNLIHNLVRCPQMKAQSLPQN